VQSHKRNLGNGAAIRDCFEWARELDADVLITLDADGQHDPSEIPTLLEAMKTNQQI
jgi:dolichol-phosphate mannosyltransferase